MSEEMRHIEIDKSPEQRLFEQGSLEVARIAESRIKEIDDAAEEAVRAGESFIEKTTDEKEKARLKSKTEEIKSLASRAKEAIYYYTRFVVLGGLLLNVSKDSVVHAKADETFDEQIHRAKIEMAQKGITSEQEGTYKPIVNDLIHRGVVPVGYDWPRIRKDFAENLFGGRPSAGEGSYRTGIMESREDAWRLYLGLPQEHGTFGISSYQPAKSTEEKYYFKINNFFEDFLQGNGYFSENVISATWVRAQVESIEHSRARGDQQYLRMDPNFVMGTYTLTSGQDEHGSYIAYYDKWDLDVWPENTKGLFGKPFEIYDRLYYDPITFEPIGLCE